MGHGLSCIIDSLDNSCLSESNESESVHVAQYSKFSEHHQKSHNNDKNNSKQHCCTVCHHGHLVITTIKNMSFPFNENSQKSSLKLFYKNFYKSFHILSLFKPPIYLS